MLKKIYNTIFIVLFLAVLAVPFVLTDWSSGGVSEDENRNLAKFPEVIKEGQWNETFTGEFETWFMDHLGLRQELITANATLQYRVFDRMLSQSDYHIGPNGDINYATEEMIRDYAHVNLRKEDSVGRLGQSYQTVSDWLAQKDIPFYYIQCYDKHTIYPEQFTNAVRQIGDVSKTDQILNYLRDSTTVKAISLKQPLLDAKPQYEVYSNWGDPSHWTDRGAYVGYLHIMERLNQDQKTPLKVLQESDYEITTENVGITLNRVIHQDDFVEVFKLRNPQAQQADNSVMGKWQDQYHTVWKNPNAGNDLKLLLLCDSYFNNYLVDDFAESFSEVWVIWADYMQDLPQMLEIYDADMVIIECAERVDRNANMYNLAQSLAN